MAVALPASGFPPPPWGMIADDLTGACDAAVAFARHGFRTAVLPAGVAVGADRYEMVVLPTFSRDDDVAGARRKVEQACGLLAGRGIRLIYKKIDSTLKGNLAAEIDAVLAAGGFSSVVVTPAFPAMGRTVVGGVLHVAGGATLLNVPSLLADVRAAQSKDARTDGELREVAATAMASGGKVLCVGSGGLAAQLAELLAAHFGSSARGEQVHPGRRGPALFVMGSEQPATRAQVDYLLRSRPAVGYGLDVDPQEAATAFREGCHLVVTADPAKGTAAGAGRLLAVARAHLNCGLVVSGGDTAEWISRAAAVSTIELRGEVLPGIPWGEATSRSAQQWCMVTKAGGFGAEDALALVGDFLTGENDKRAS